MQFLQSIFDFPQMVTLGEKLPSFGLHRYRQGLRFVPVEDEGFTLRGDKRRLLYKGRLRSHRFTILGNTAFEYDCILQREPESNVIRLRIDGAENYDFFRQPDFVDDPFLQGSFAVYKKETLIGEGTGKICHIHRPEIIDARGRRCWGDLAVAGNELHITIPEKWLGEAAYPVVVDPVVGTDTVGSLDVYKLSGSSVRPLTCWDTMILNKVVMPENMELNITFYVYKNKDFVGNQRIVRNYPCMYNNVNNKPNTKISVNEMQIIDPYNYNQSGWLQAGISKNCPINQGDNIWFGVRGCYLILKFDYGGVFEEIDVYESYAQKNILLPQVLGTSVFSPFLTTQYNKDLKISMYLDFERVVYNYIKKIVQGITLNDTKIIKISYLRNIFQFVNGAGLSKPFVRFFRQCLMIVTNSMRLERLPAFFRYIYEITGISEAMKNRSEKARKCIDNAVVKDGVRKSKGFIIGIIDNFIGTDTNDFNILFVRSVNETKKITDNIDKWNDYIRGLFIEAGYIAETSHIGNYYRKKSEKVQAKGSVLRKLFYILKIISKAFVRDFIIGRFLIARKELILKSCVVRDICIDSRIN